MKNTVRKATSFLLVIVLLLSAINVIAASTFDGDEVLYDHEPYSEHGMTPAELEEFLPTGITLDIAEDMWFCSIRGMYYFPQLGLYYDPVSNMLFEPNHELWLDPEEHSIVSIHDMPTGGFITDGQWLDFDMMHSNYQSIVPASSPIVTLQILSITYHSITVSGTVTNIGGAVITGRGFWIRDDDHATHFEEYLVDVQTNTFTATFRHLRSSHMYHIRAIVRVEGVNGARQSDAQSIMTLSQPGGGTPTPTPTTPPGGTTPTPTAPPGGTTPTPTAPPGGTTPTPAPTPTPTPTPPPTPFLSFASSSTPWDGQEWRISSGAISTNSIVHSHPGWEWTLSDGANSWITVSGPRQSGTTLTISVSRNDTGVRRNATITVTSGNNSERILISQAPALTSTRGTRIMTCLDRNGYVDVTTPTVSYVLFNRQSSASRPIWNFVHVDDNIFLIRNDTTGRYLTETSGNLRHEARITGAGFDRQRWRLLPQDNGSYRIRSVSNDSRYIENAMGGLTLETRNASNRQLWRIEHIWHIDPNLQHEEWFGFWRGTINIRAITVGNVIPDDFNFISRMNNARRAWENVLNISFNTVTDMSSANIRAYGGHRDDIQEHLGREDSFPPDHFRYGTNFGHGVFDPVTGRVGSISAGGASRGVFELTGTGESAMIMVVFTDNGGRTADARNIRFTAMTTMHELGHSLGYRGESPNRNDVMIGVIPITASPNETLTPAEIEHLRQIYRMFR